MSVAAVQRFKTENPIRTIHVQKPKGMNYPPTIHHLISMCPEWSSQAINRATVWSSNVEDEDFGKIVVEYPIPNEVLDAISRALTEHGIKKSKRDGGNSPQEAKVGLLFIAQNFENFAVNKLFRHLEYNNSDLVNEVCLDDIFASAINLLEPNPNKLLNERAWQIEEILFQMCRILSDDYTEPEKRWSRSYEITAKADTVVQAEITPEDI